MSIARSPRDSTLTFSALNAEADARGLKDQASVRIAIRPSREREQAAAASVSIASQAGRPEGLPGENSKPARSPNAALDNLRVPPIATEDQISRREDISPTAHQSLSTLARLLGRQAGREWLSRSTND